MAPTHQPGCFEDFVKFVVPELQKRGIYRKDYSVPPSETISGWRARISAPGKPTWINSQRRESRQELLPRTPQNIERTMPLVQAAQIEKIAADLLEAAGASRAEAETVARHSVGANLTGHDSHGIIQIPTYIDRIDKGHIVPGAPIDVMSDTPTTTVVDGNWGFGYVVTEEVMRRTIEKAKTSNVAAATVFRQGHVGRVADYPLMAAEAGMIGIMTADSGRAPKAVAPFGGREARLGTNPISIAVPSNLDGPCTSIFPRQRPLRADQTRRGSWRTRS